MSKCRELPVHTMSTIHDTASLNHSLSRCATSEEASPCSSHDAPLSSLPLSLNQHPVAADPSSTRHQNRLFIRLSKISISKPHLNNNQPHSANDLPDHSLQNFTSEDSHHYNATKASSSSTSKLPCSEDKPCCAGLAPRGLVCCIARA